MNAKGSFSIYTDGACSGNPGPMGIGCAIYKDKKIIETISVGKGHGTNNEAEYLAVIEGLSNVIKYNPKTVSVFSDSQLVVKQINREYSVKNTRMMSLRNQIDELIEGMSNTKICFNWISRTKNQVADNLASTAIGHNQGLMKGKILVEWDTSYISENKKGISLLNKATAECEQLIIAANYNNEKLKFSDFIELKTHGVDEYSYLNEDDLLECIIIRFGEKSLDWITEVLEGTDSSFKKDALRWTARGLYPSLALKKASVNAEMKNKFKK